MADIVQLIGSKDLFEIHPQLRICFGYSSVLSYYLSFFFFVLNDVIFSEYCFFCLFVLKNIASSLSAVDKSFAPSEKKGSKLYPPCYWGGALNGTPSL